MTIAQSLPGIPPLESEAPLAAPKKRRKALIVLPLLTALALAGSVSAYALGHGKETTDDAQVEGHVTSVAPRVAGLVKSVLVKDNQPVKAGDLLVQLDDRDLVARAAAARADLAAAKAQLRAAETNLALTERTADSNLVVAKGGLAQAAAVQGTTGASIEQSEADVASAESRRQLAQLDLGRTENLFNTGALSQAELDARRSGLEQADAALRQAKARLQSAKANLANSSGTIESARGRLILAQTGPDQVEAARAQVELGQARVDQAKAALDQAELNLSYTRITAEASGVVARRSVEVGQLASPERPLMAIVPLDDTWIVANFKEDQIRDMRPGQSARVTIDTYGGAPLSAHVDSLAGGTGARFSLLPPDNASGNFTKVVQRVPVLLRLDARDGLTLRPGMSATVNVYTK